MPGSAPLARLRAVNGASLKSFSTLRHRRTSSQ